MECLGETTQTRECNTEACGVVYKISHRTGNGEWDAGARTGMYDFTLIGTEGTVGPIDCAADRSKGVYSTCTFELPTNIGKVRTVKIKNKGADMWAFTTLFVNIAGKLNARWQASGGPIKVQHWSLVELQMTNILDHDISYTITHKTGTATYDEGGRTGAYVFNLIGSLGETLPFDCNADRSAGAVGTCTVSSNSELGKLLKVRIKNKTDNHWVFKTFKVEVDGEVVANWAGSKKVPDRQTVLAVFQ